MHLLGCNPQNPGGRIKCVFLRLTSKSERTIYGVCLCSWGPFLDFFLGGSMSALLPDLSTDLFTQTATSTTFGATTRIVRIRMDLLNVFEVFLSFAIRGLKDVWQKRS